MHVRRRDAPTDRKSRPFAGLLRQHQELSGAIRDANAVLIAKRSALDAIEAALRVFDPTITPATEYRRRGDALEGLHRFPLDQLRRHGKITTISAATARIEQRGLDAHDKTLVTHMRKRCGDALQKMRRQGKVVGERYGKDGELEWRLTG